MAGGYFYKNNPINSLIQPGGTTSVSDADSFVNFPRILSSNVNSNFESVGHSNFGGFANAYKVGNAMLPIGTANQGINKIVSRYTDYNFNSDGAVQAVNIPSGLTTSPNHITAILIGGGGGRGGGGGLGRSLLRYDGGHGGAGGGGAYCYIEKIPYTGTMNVIVGGGGKGGGGGAKADIGFYNEGTDGGDGDPGGATILNMAGKGDIITANGGNGGNKGGGGNKANYGGDGTFGTPGSVNRNVNTNFILKTGSTEVIFVNYLQYTDEVVSTFANTNPTVPFLNNYGKCGVNGGRGGGAEGASTTNERSAEAGESGEPGLCRIYFLYI